MLTEFNRNVYATWLVKNMDRYNRINQSRDAGNSVASFEKEFIATFEQRKREVIESIDDAMKWKETAA